MQPLINAGFFGTLICAVAAFYLVRKKNALWKGFCAGMAFCGLLAAAGLAAAPFVEEKIRPPKIQFEPADLIKYEIRSVNAPSEREVRAWRRGLACSLTYNILVEKNTPSEAEFARIAGDIVEKDAKARRNWNYIYFYLHTPEGLKSGVAYMSATYSLNGSAEQSSKVRPGEYDDNFRFVIRVI
ncbi:MAG: hypothetical protein LBO03_01090 [Acidaminococcales bacterium]|jgi:hypothetical protein|nr:hypothetical protein [Acidaminococcales bacterium]